MCDVFRYKNIKYQRIVFHIIHICSSNRVFHFKYNKKRITTTSDTLIIKQLYS